MELNYTSVKGTKLLQSHLCILPGQIWMSGLCLFNILGVRFDCDFLSGSNDAYARKKIKSRLSKRHIFHRKAFDLKAGYVEELLGFLAWAETKVVQLVLYTDRSSGMQRSWGMKRDPRPPRGFLWKFLKKCYPGSTKVLNFKISWHSQTLQWPFVENSMTFRQSQNFSIFQVPNFLLALVLLTVHW